jgi:hypothetical protein
MEETMRTMLLGTRRPRRRAAAAIAIATLMFSLSASGQSPVPKQGTFKVRHKVSGSVEELPFGTGRTVSIFHLEGTVEAQREGGPMRDMNCDCLGLMDSKTGNVGRCLWTDKDGDKVFIELKGQLAAAGGKSRATFTGGTGKYTGISGGYDVVWAKGGEEGEPGGGAVFFMDSTGEYKLP